MDPKILRCEQRHRDGWIDSVNIARQEPPMFEKTLMVYLKPIGDNVLPIWL